MIEECMDPGGSYWPLSTLEGNGYKRDGVEGTGRVPFGQGLNLQRTVPGR